MKGIRMNKPGAEDKASEAKRKEIVAEYKSQMEKSETRLDELRAKNRGIEDCLDEIQALHLSTKSILTHHQSAHYQYGSHKECELLQQVEEELNNDYHIAETVFLDEQEEIERERKKIFREREDIESEYRYAMLALDEK